MKLAIVFWFYKEPDICRERLEFIKNKNPGLKIFGLYGGDLSLKDEFRDKTRTFFR